MKHTLLLILIATLAGGLYAIPILDIELGLGLDFPGNFDYENSDFNIDEAEDTKFGFSPYAEVLLPLGPNLLLGGGAEYQIPRSLDADDAMEGKFGFVPIYATAKYGVSMIGIVRPELLLQLGYNFQTGDDDYKDDLDLTGGLYWGVGAGVKLPLNITAALLYRMNQGGMEGDDTETDISVSQLTMRFGYRF